ncbi:MAG: DOMON-like domain-containing protein [Myxacorys californica WJT36-NPBG1]|jgi:hypothetical protein|nr:DOMON-like domain-containing protein [Myxacorys californica WJT36-NPBG1]
MNEFLLKPFSSPSIDLTITGSIERRSGYLTIRYDLRGDLTAVVIPIPASAVRQHDLWKTTCFEFFLGLKHSKQYWEFNLSPAGHWNVYRFDGYRQGMQEELAIAALPVEVRQTSDALMLTIALSLEQLEVAEQGLDVAIASVIESKSGEITYWALTHPEPEADFHRRDSFLIQL